MFKRITDKKDYIRHIDVRQYPMNLQQKIKKSLFGHEVLLENDPWMWHLHLKVTNRCQAQCKFCIEQGIKTKENCDFYLQRLNTVLKEMEQQGILYSVSVTGGEPMLFEDFKELVQVLTSHKIKFLTMNTNAILLDKYLDIVDNNFDFVDISRHFLDDTKNENVFQNKDIPTLTQLREIKSKMKHCKMRLQCVITEDMDYNNFLNRLNVCDFADDFSFRRLMSTSDIHNVTYNTSKSNTSYYKILDKVSNEFDLVEQVLQDYYVYETWKKDKSQVTFSYSDMALLTKQEKQENSNICREFILHPNGIFSGSWDYKKKILLQ